MISWRTHREDAFQSGFLMGVLGATRLFRRYFTAEECAGELETPDEGPVDADTLRQWAVEDFPDFIDIGPAAVQL